MRLVKLVSKIKQLQVIVMGLGNGLGSVTYILILLVLVFYLFAVLGVNFFRKNDPFHFGSVGVAMLSLFRFATLENWGPALYVDIFGCDAQYSGAYGVCYFNSRCLNSAHTFSHDVTFSGITEATERHHLMN
jgi:voltage-gated sodium channel